MPRERSPDRNKAKQSWLVNTGKLKLKDLVTELGLVETRYGNGKAKINGKHRSKGRYRYSYLLRQSRCV
ncbi:phage terminase small subunit-related protein [Paenibacillus oryzisoli]|uniref:PBSX phage terminase small subunit-like N-terminal domain-containing protein n=1 Tax=Paenibacillus oryzisoli TaxID=1850517 RepID=A0A198A1U5_9BACL|nr:hypothetical protein A8708_14330 [Paenibacillus oryzisoli]